MESGWYRHLACTTGRVASATAFQSDARCDVRQAVNKFLLWLGGVALAVALLAWIAFSILSGDDEDRRDVSVAPTLPVRHEEATPTVTPAPPVEAEATRPREATPTVPGPQATHAAELERALRNAPRRKAFDVRGVRLWMSLDEVRAALADEIESWDAGPTPVPAEAPYDRRSAVAKLRDGATFECEFTSAQSGARLFVFVYEQNLRDGPAPEALLAELQKKYGPPDQAKDTGAYWADYDLPSAAEPIEAYGPLGAFFKIHFRRDDAGRVDYLRLVFNDASLGRHDEQAVFQARQAAAREEFEKGKSGEAKF